jgi:hypothetical protein
MTRRLHSIGSTLLALLTAAWMTLAPLVPTLHQAFAGHRHIYCLEHQRVEDAGPRETSGLPSAGRPPRAGSVAERPAGSGSRPSCVFSNLWRYAPVTVSALTLTSSPVSLVETRRATTESPRVFAVLPSAPKHSPPHSA